MHKMRAQDFSQTRISLLMVNPLFIALFQFHSLYFNISNVANKVRNRLYYTKLAENAIEAHNKTLDEEDFYELRSREFDTEYSFNYPLNTETERSGLRMMIEAIFEIFYEPFDWKLFSDDVQNYPQDTGYNPTITPEMMQSIERLKSIESYAKKRKFPKR